MFGLLRKEPPKFEIHQMVYISHFECQVVYVNRHSPTYEYVLQFPDRTVGMFRENEIDQICQHSPEHVKRF